MEMRGTVRFRFRLAEYDVDVLLEGEGDKVEELRQEIGLSGDVGVLQPLAARMADPDEEEPESAVGDFGSGLPCPHPVAKQYYRGLLPTLPGSLSNQENRRVRSRDQYGELGGRKSSNPDMSAICEILDELEEEVEPLSDTMSGDPLAEAWIQLLLTLVVREHGQHICL